MPVGQNRRIQWQPHLSLLLVTRVQWGTTGGLGRLTWARGVGDGVDLRKLDMVQHCKWIAYGIVGLGGKSCTRMRPKLHLPVFWARFPSHCFHGIVRNLEGRGRAVPHRSIRE